MALLLDTSTVEPGAVATELHRALRAAGAAAAAAVTPLVPLSAFRATVHGWSVGEGITLMHSESDPIAVATTAPRIHAQPFNRVALAAVSAGSWTHLQHGRRIDPTDQESTLLIVDPACPFDFRRSDRGAATVVHVDVGLLNLPPTAIRAAAIALRRAHPLHRLYLDHLDQLRCVAQTCPAILPELGTTTNLLTRSLILDVADGPAPVPIDDAGDLLTRLSRHITENLTDGELSATAIARAHNISVRTLYKTWESTGTSLQEHIIGLRLDRARDTLLSHPHLTIAAVARQHGFADPTHFTHRFRDRFKVNPRDWRLTNRRPLDG